MTIKKIAEQLKTRKDIADIDYKWTDIVLRRRLEDIDKPLAEQHITLAVRCVGAEDGAESPMPEEQISIKLTTEQILSLSATKKNKIKAFVNMCEAGCKSTGDTYVEDFTLTEA